MSEIDAALVRELREKTGIGMMECKAALIESNGNIDSAIQYLRKKGLASAEKKASRTATEGLVGIYLDEKKASMVEINSETDFVSRNQQFQEFVENIAKITCEKALNSEDLLESNYPGSDKTIKDELNALVLSIGENIAIRRSITLSSNKGLFFSYIHNAVRDSLGKIGVLLEIESTCDRNKIEPFAKQIAMHIAAMNPMAVSSSEVDESVLAREKEIYQEQVRASGKPAEMIDKIVDGKLKKFFSEVVLTEQKFVVDDQKKVSEAIAEKEKEFNEKIFIKSFKRFLLGEGLEKKQEDFSAEVSKITK
jgi:elongation factor Ts|tara:strand:+ start:1024 stop:1947 length:924 start_codon:yes stop_codon:yes gene_type:complete